MENTNVMPSELDDEYFKSYAKKNIKDAADKAANKAAYDSSKDAQQEQIQYCTVERGNFKPFRFLGLQPGATNRRPTDAKQIMYVEVKDDNGKKFTIYMPLPTGEVQDQYILQRLYNKVTESVKINGQWVDVNKAKYPDLYNLVTKGGYKPEDGKSYTYSKGYKGDHVTIFNVLDRSDDWCATNKHSKVLCRDLNIDEQNRVWAKPGIKSYGFTNKLDGIMSSYGSLGKYDIAVKQTGIKENPFELKNASKMKEAGIYEEFVNSDGSFMPMDNVKVGVDNDELSFERYDLDKLFGPTPAYWLQKRIPKLFKLCDACLGTDFEAELNSIVEKENAAWKAAHPSTKTTESEEAQVAAAENAAINANLEANPTFEDQSLDPYSQPVSTPTPEPVAPAQTTNFDNMATVTPTVEPRIARREAPASAVAFDISKLTGWSRLSAEQQSLITGYTEKTIDGRNVIEVQYKPCEETSKLLECDCGTCSPKSWTVCPACNASF